MRGPCLLPAVCWCVCFGSPLGAQVQDLRPGDARLRDFPLTPFVATYQVYVDSDSAPQKAEYWKWHLQESHLAGQPAYRLVWSLFFGSGTVYDEVVFHAGTYEPIIRRILSFRGTDLVDFTGPAPRYSYVPAASLADSTYTQRGLDIEGSRFGGGDLLALAAVRPAVGEQFRLALYATDPGPSLGSNLWDDVEVLRRDRIEAAGREFDVTIVRRGPWTLWLTDRPPYVVRRAVMNRRWELVDIWETRFTGN